MININLLPEELREIERTRKIKVNIAKIGSAVVVAVVIALVVVFYVIGQRVRHIAAIKARLKELTPKSQEAERLIAKKKQVEKEIGMIESFGKGRVLWNRRLNEISDALPDDLYLVSLSYRDKPPYQLTIKGEGVSGRVSEHVVEFIDNLRKAPDFIERFSQTAYSIENIAGNRQSFEIRCSPENK